MAPEMSVWKKLRLSNGACFNEAGACWPRKSSLKNSASTQTLCFNEAGACWPRKCLTEFAKRGPMYQASMRPGPVGPGNDLAPLLRETEGVASMRPGPVGPGNVEEDDGKGGKCRTLQ